MIYKTFLSGAGFNDLDRVAYVKTCFNSIPAVVATFEFMEIDGDYDLLVTYDGAPVDISIVTGDTKKKIVNKILAAILTKQNIDHTHVLLDTAFYSWFKSNYESYYTILLAEMNGDDSNELFTGSADFMEIYYQYLLGYEEKTTFGSQLIYFKYDPDVGVYIQANIRTGEEKNIRIVSSVSGEVTLLGVYSTPIERGIEHIYRVINNKLNNIDMVGLYIDGNLIFNNLALPEVFSAIRGQIGIGGVHDTVKVSNIEITPKVHFYDNFTDYDTIETDTEIEGRYFTYKESSNAAFTITNGTKRNLVMTGNTTLFIRSYKYREMNAVFVAKGNGIRIYFMKQVPNTNLSTFNSNYIDIEFGDIETVFSYYRAINGANALTSISNGLYYPPNATYTIGVNITDGNMSISFNGEEVWGDYVNDITPGAYDYGYVGLANLDGDGSMTVESIEINGNEKFGRGLQIGRYIDDFDYDSRKEYNGGR